MLQSSFVDRIGSRALGVFELAGAIATFGAHAIIEAPRPPYELREILRHAYQLGCRSAPLIVTAGVAIGVVSVGPGREQSLTAGGPGAPTRGG